MPSQAINYASGIFTPEGLAAALERFPSQARASLRDVLRDQARHLRKDAVDRFRSRGVGRGVFGLKDRGAYGLIRTRVRDDARSAAVVLTLELRGFAAMQESGGMRTKPHVIRAEAGRLAALAEAHAGRRRGRSFARRAAKSTRRLLAIPIGGAAGFGGEMIFRAQVQHPGGAVPQRPFAAEAMRQRAPQIRAALEAALAALVRGGFARVA